MTVVVATITVSTMEGRTTLPMLKNATMTSDAPRIRRPNARRYSALLTQIKLLARRLFVCPS